MALDTTTPPTIVDIDPEAIFLDIKTDFEARMQAQGYTGYLVYPGDPMYAALRTLAYRETVQLAKVQSAALQTLVSFSTAPVLDYLAQNRNVTRLAATAAVCTIRFTLVNGHGALTIPAGLRVATVDGKYFFATNAETFVIPGANSIDIDCTADEVGEGGNGYQPGDVNVIADPQPYLTAAANLDETSLGSDEETDAALRERVILANSTYSNAGSEEAYEYFARSVSPAIIDVKATTPYPGTADIYVLTNSLQTTTQAVLDEVDAVLSPLNIRPMCDTKNVLSAIRIPYALNINLTLFEGETSQTEIDTVTAALTSYTNASARKIGIDVLESQVRKLAKTDAVYGVDVSGFTDLVVDDKSFAVCTSINVSVVGFKPR